MQASDRREFLARGLCGTAAAVWAGSTVLPRSATAEPRRPGPTVVAFTKSFQDWPIPEVCRQFRSIGLDGLDLTVRPRGHIDPKDVAVRLPKAVAAAKDVGVCIPMLTTAITDPDDDARRLLETAAKLEIRFIKLGYYRYKGFGSLKRQLADVRKRLAAVIKLAKQFGVRPCVHIHSGSYLPSHGTLLYQMIRDFEPTEVGAYVDMLHMVLEGGRTGWRQGLDLLAPWITLCAVKNFWWKRLQRDRYGQQRWTTEVVPVADGISPIPEFVAALKKLGFQGVYSLHSEYKGRHSFRDLTTQQCLEQTAVDLRFFRSLL